jgi:hypothetical protein
VSAVRHSLQAGQKTTGQTELPFRPQRPGAAVQGGGSRESGTREKTMLDAWYRRGPGKPWEIAQYADAWKKAADSSPDGYGATIPMTARKAAPATWASSIGHQTLGQHLHSADGRAADTWIERAVSTDATGLK